MIFLTTKPILKADITEPFIVSNFQYKAKVLQFFFSLRTVSVLVRGS